MAKNSNEPAKSVAKKAKEQPEVRIVHYRNSIVISIGKPYESGPISDDLKKAIDDVLSKY